MRGRPLKGPCSASARVEWLGNWALVEVLLPTGLKRSLMGVLAGRNMTSQGSPQEPLMAHHLLGERSVPMNVVQTLSNAKHLVEGIQIDDFNNNIMRWLDRVRVTRNQNLINGGLRESEEG